MNKNAGFSIIFIILSFTAALSTCVSANAKYNLDWEGRYAGRIPSASGSGINVQITLHSDQTFSLIYNYIDRDFYTTSSGSFDWDVTGNIIAFRDSDYPPYYRVERGYLRQLDLDGNEISGNLAGMYMLKKSE